MSNEKKFKELEPIVDELFKFHDFNPNFEYDNKMKTQHKLIKQANYHPCTIFKGLGLLTIQLRKEKADWAPRMPAGFNLGVAIPHRSRIQSRIDRIEFYQTQFMDQCVKELDEQKTPLKPK